MPPEALAETVVGTTSAAGSGQDPVEEVVLALTRVWSDARLYPPTHPVIRERLRDAEARVAEALGGCTELTVKHVDGDLIHGSQRLFRTRPRPAGIIGALQRLGVGCITVSPGTNADELSTLCCALAEDSGTLADASAVRRYLDERGVRHIEVDGLLLRPEGGPEERVPIVQLYDAAMDVARQVMQSARLGHHIEVAGAQSITTQMVAQMTQNPATAVSLASLRGHDEYSFAHCVHTALLCLAFGDFMGMSQDELGELGVAAMLHDVGKAAVPIEVLRKPSRLSGAEWDLMTRHPSEGALMLLDHDELPPSVPVVAYEHHIGCDYLGYPKVAHDRTLSLPSLVVSLADVYDALTTHRPYRPPMSPEQALGEIAQMASRHLDPRLVEWFRAMLGVYPPSTCVVLDTGEVAVVCETNHREPERPLVAIVTDANGNQLHAPRDADLAESHEGRHARSVRCVVAAADSGIDPARVIDGWLERNRFLLR